MESDLSYLKKYIIKYRLKILIAVLFLGLESLLGLLQPLLMSKIIDKGIGLNDLAYVYRIGILMVALTGLMGIFTVIRNRYSSTVSQSFGADMREDLYIHIQGLSLEDINSLEISSLLTRLTNDVAQVQAFAHSIMRVFLKAPLIGIGSVLLSFILDWKLSLIVMGTIPLVFLLIRKNLQLSYPLFKKIQESIDGMNRQLREYLSAIRVVKAFNRYDYEEEKFKKANQTYREANIRGRRISAIFSPLVALIINTGIVLIIYFGGISVSGGGVELGQLVALIDYMSQILFSLLMLNNFMNRGLRARTSAERIGQVFILDKEDMKEAGSGAHIDSWSLEFKNVNFSYSGKGGRILRDISFSLEEGEELAIIGSTGSGKTSLINLLNRLYEVDSGSIFIGGRDIRQLDKEYLRSKIGIVSQKALLFKGSIEENLKWGNEGATREDVIEVAKLVEAHEFISSFKDDYNTIVGEGGVNLSGGQKQRLSIARSLLRRPKLLVLDDSSSALDLITEGKIRENLRGLDSSMTIILIAQRINSVLEADKILVLEGGDLVGVGSHNELMKNSRTYQEIYESQIGKEGGDHEI